MAETGALTVGTARLTGAVPRGAGTQPPWREAWHALRAWLRGSLARRFVALSLGLLLAVQFVSFCVVDASLRRHARAALPEQLEMGTRTLQSLLDWRAQRLTEGANLLAADYGFRAAVQSNDRETIASVLSNHGARIGATEVALLDTSFKPIALAEGSVWDAGSSAATVAKLAAAATANTGPDSNSSTHTAGTGALAVLGGQPRQVVLVPLKAPVLVGWVLMYFPLPASIADDVQRQSIAELTLLTRAHAGAPWSVAFSRLEPGLARGLAAQRWEASAAALPAGLQEVRVGDELLGARPLWLTAPAADPEAAGPTGARTTQTQTQTQTQAQPQALAVLSVSVEKALRPPRDLQIALLAATLLGFAAFGMGSVYTARHITTPLRALAAAAERLGAGDSGTPIQSTGAHGEVLELARALEQMRISVTGKQEQIVQSEKLASIGQLAAGVAHEINNPIGFVFSNFGTLEDYLARLFRMLGAYREAEAALAGQPSAERLARLRAEIELDYLEEDIPALMSESKDGIRRVRKIVQDLKDFSHVDPQQHWERVDLHAGIDSTLNIVNNEIKYKADLVREYGTLPEVECLPHELNQVFMNLLVNAAHAIGEQRGTITLRTGVGAARSAAAAPEEVWVEVADNGSGIAPADLPRIFDPFFTTKPVGKGTGLGLSLSYGIVKKHGGRIEVTSEPGQGTSFRVCLPTRRPAGAGG